MKKINVLFVFGLFALLVNMAQPVSAAVLGSWVPTVTSVRDSSAAHPEIPTKEVAQLNAAISKFEGLLNAYSTSQVRGDIPRHPDFIWIPVQVDNNLRSAASDLSSSLEQFNTALMEVYPTLSEEEQLAVREAYSSLGLYLEDLAAETNSVFGREFFRIVKEVEPKGIDSVQTFGLVLGPGQ